MAPPPRRPARGRQADRLILYFVLEGGAPLTPQQQGQLLERLAQTYFKSPGSVTAALRSAAETLNQLLFERNLNSAGSQQGVGLLTLITLRGEQVFLAQCGPMQTFLIKATGVDHLHDPDATLRGLGLGRATSIHYSQAALSPGDTLVTSHRPPPTWSTITLNGIHGQGPEGMRRRLLSQAGPDVEAILVQAKNGPGQVHLLQPQPLPSYASPRAVVDEIDFETGPGPQAAGRPPAAVPGAPPEEPESRDAGPAGTPSSQPAIVAEAPIPARTAPPSGPTPEERAAPPLPDYPEPSPAGSPVSPPAASQPAGRSARRALSGIGRSILGGMGRTALAGQTLARRMLPGEGVLPSSVMALFAVAIPLVVVTVSMVVYFERGRMAQYQVFYAQAVQAAQQAQEQTDPPARRTYWEAALANLDLAENYRQTPESEALRAEAQGFFDELEAIERLDFQPAIAGGVPSSFKITRMIATGSELFMLDANSGNAARTFLAGQVYEYDDGFQCGPSFLAGQNLGPLIDIAPLPQGNQLEASLLAMDAQGNLIQCTPGETPILYVLAPPPTNWGEPRAFTLDSGDLYVLDPETNAVWVYWGSAFTSQPQFFFSEDVPPMQDVIDLAVDKTDLYLLHADGHVTLCTFSSLGVSPTRCTDPVPYIDSRAGREGRLLIPEATFTQIRSTPPPDPSLYLLESQSRAIYHFSLRLLTFQRQFRSQTALPSTPASAFAIRPDSRVAFLAFDNRVFYAGLP